MKYMNDTGETTVADPTRLMWYAHSCTYWTDEWDTLSKNGNIPCCPHCKSVGYQTDYDDWMNGVQGYDELHPGYEQFVLAYRNKCAGNGISLDQLWELRRE